MNIKSFFRIGEANDEIKRLTAELETAKASQLAAEQARDVAVTEVTPLKEKITLLEGQVGTLTTERDAAKATVTEQATKITNLEATAATVELRAAEIAAGVGNKSAVGADVNAGGAKTREQLWSEYNAMPVADRNAFYKANRKLMAE